MAPRIGGQKPPSLVQWRDAIILHCVTARWTAPWNSCLKPASNEPQRVAVDQPRQYVNQVMYRKHHLETTGGCRGAQCERASVRVIVWQWGRFGAGPRLAVSLAQGFSALGGVETQLSLSTAAEVMNGADGASCHLPVQTYSGVNGLAWRLLQGPITVMQLSRQLRRLDPRFAVCAMPGPLDLLMVLALHRVGIPAAVIVHDAEAHPGDRIPLLHTSQRALLRRADLVIVLSTHVAAKLRANGSLRPDTPIVMAVAACPQLRCRHPLGRAWRASALALFWPLAGLQRARSPRGSAAIDWSPAGYRGAGRG